MRKTIVPIIDKTGESIALIQVDDTLEYIGGRVCKGEKFYYKGLGGIYKYHHSLTKEYDVIGPAEVFYYGYKLQNPKWVNKFGIFMERMQPFFSDWCFGCGKKELRLAENIRTFKKASVTIDNIVKWSDENGGQYYFVLNYDCGRKKYLQEPHPQELLDLLEYMLAEDWCVPWDKGFISDITYDGRVSDAADMFKSRVFKHKLGTVYSALHSLWQKDKKAFNEVAKLLGAEEAPTVDGLWTGVYIVSVSYCFVKGVPTILPDKSDTIDVAKWLIRDTLLLGRNCAAVEDVRKGNPVIKQYVKRFRRVIDEAKDTNSSR